MAARTTPIGAQGQHEGHGACCAEQLAEPAFFSRLAFRCGHRLGSGANNFAEFFKEIARELFGGAFNQSAAELGQLAADFCLDR